MARYVSRPTEVEAVQWTGDNPDEIEKAIGADKASTTIFGDGRLYIMAGVDGAQDWVPVPKGHWLLHVPGDLSAVWPVENEAFLRKYEKV